MERPQGGDTPLCHTARTRLGLGTPSRAWADGLIADRDEQSFRRSDRQISS
jgi:hypothetical protein